MQSSEEEHEIMVKKGKNGAIDYVTCYTCNTSYPSAEAMLKEHINIPLHKIPYPGSDAE